MRNLELFFDVVQVIDIVIVFLTPIKQTEVDEKTKEWFAGKHKQGDNPEGSQTFSVATAQESEWVIDMRLLAWEYAKTHLLWDALACLPGLLTLEKILWLYLFKVLRFLKITRVLTF